MGRYTTGAITTKEAIRIELSYLIKMGIIKKGFKLSTSLGWNNGSSIQIETSYAVESQSYIRLIYSLTDREGNKKNYDYKIRLVTVVSNLRKGKILYFLCPITSKKCRVLYRCYGSSIWKSRDAYQNRIYYKSQISSKTDNWNDKYWNCEEEIKRLITTYRNQSIYKGKLTKRALKLQKLYELQDHAEQMRWLLCINRSLFKNE